MAAGLKPSSLQVPLEAAGAAGLVSWWTSGYVGTAGTQHRAWLAERLNPGVCFLGGSLGRRSKGVGEAASLLSVTRNEN